MRRLRAAGVSAAVGVLMTAATVAAQGPAPNGALRIGVVDFQRVVARSSAGAAAREQLERDESGMRKELDGKRQEIEKLQEELDKKGSLMTAEARRERSDLIERRRRDITRLADDFRRELAKKEEVLRQRVSQEIFGIVERIGKERGFHLIVERRSAGVIYAVAETDITEEIIKSYDQQGGVKGKN